MTNAKTIRWPTQILGKHLYAKIFCKNIPVLYIETNVISIAPPWKGSKQKTTKSNRSPEEYDKNTLQWTWRHFCPYYPIFLLRSISFRWGSQTLFDVSLIISHCCKWYFIKDYEHVMYYIMTVNWKLLKIIYKWCLSSMWSRK